MTSVQTMSAEGGRAGHLVRIATLNCRPVADLSALVGRAEQVIRQRTPDLFVLPESCRGQGAGTSEEVDGPTVSAMRRLAREFQTYVVCPIDRIADGVRWNSAVLIDRTGDVAGIYDKMFPYWPELDLTPPVRVGTRAPVWETDFGRVGIAICFDVNFPPVWQELARGGADLVVWTSAYAGGSIVGAYADIHHYYVVTCTQAGESRAYDMTGAEIGAEIGGDVDGDDDAPVSSFTIDTDRQIYHENFNLDNLWRLLKEKPDEVELERRLLAEQWFVLRARRPGVRVRGLAHAYGLEPIQNYVSRSMARIDDLRGPGGRP